MNSEPISFLLVTANVGSVFEDPSRLLKTWIQEFTSKVVMQKPQFVALHLQEVGGKTYEKSMEYVQDFIKLLCESKEMENYSRIRVYLDEDYTSAEHFTALGNLYFVEKSLQAVKIWNFLTHEWENCEGKSIHTGNIEAVATKEKAKFPQHFFPECKWSRKGFLRTRWEIKGTVVDMVNIHLFHDASNLAACEEFPSVYCKSRRRALVHTLERFHKDMVNGMAPYFIFGDFNFRCDTEGVVRKLTDDLSIHRIMNVKNDSTKVQYRNDGGNNVLTVGKKEFTHVDHQIKFKESWLQQFDRELEPLKEVLVEYPITFPPSYPYEEEPSLPKNYMPTRCPAWCDRILMSLAAKDLVIDDNFSSKDYNTIGDDVCMGDHKPIYLNIRLKVFKGTYTHCCEHELNLNNLPASASSYLILNNNGHNICCSSSISSNSSNNFNNNNNNDGHSLLGAMPTTPLPLSPLSPQSTPQIITNKIKCLYESVAYCNLLIDLFNNTTNLQRRGGLDGVVGIVNNASTIAAGAVVVVKSPLPSLQSKPHQQPLQKISIPQLPPHLLLAKYKPTINVIDTENENVCMCSMYSSADNFLNKFVVDQENNVKSQQQQQQSPPLPSQRTLVEIGVKNIAPIATMDDCDMDDDDVDIIPTSMIGSICSVCRHTIKQQPTEPRKTLISKRLTLANNIIVNRVDTHYLNLNSFSGNSLYQQDPYTPESIESHSPLPETPIEIIDQVGKDQHENITDIVIARDDDGPTTAAVLADDIDGTILSNFEVICDDCDDFIMDINIKNIIQASTTNISSSSRGVSPRQLKSRLENLQRPSTSSSATASEIMATQSNTSSYGSSSSATQMTITKNIANNTVINKSPIKNIQSLSQPELPPLLSPPPIIQSNKNPGNFNNNNNNNNNDNVSSYSGSNNKIGCFGRTCQIL